MAYPIKSTSEVNPTPMMAPPEAERRSVEDVLSELEAIIWADGGMDPGEMAAVGDFFMRTLERARAGPMGGPPQEQAPMGGPVQGGEAEDTFRDNRGEALDLAP